MQVKGKDNGTPVSRYGSFGKPPSLIKLVSQVKLNIDRIKRGRNPSSYHRARHIYLYFIYDKKIETNLPEEKELKAVFFICCKLFSNIHLGSNSMEYYTISYIL